ncbi:MAG: monofunctional biosynthetic peptidoglycan transglycosylase [Gammaproteobacteria bacterium]|nr:monofunctional biosynthetic peptidoglycan transglycosylase [Gammaproteobacteria bacterium]
MRWRRRKTRVKSRRRRWPRWAATTLCVFLLLSWLPVLALRWVAPPVTTFMLLDPDARAGLDYEWTDWSSISSSVPLAVIASEDQKFPSHSGFDLDSIRDAIDDSQNGGRLRGASTISQQVAKNLFLWNGRSFLRKGIEAYFTVLIEATWPKQRTLEVYVNVAEFGPGVFGVGAASRRFFAESPSRVGDAEAALLAAVLPNPEQLHADQPSVYVRERQRWILGQMRRLQRERVLASLD